MSRFGTILFLLASASHGVFAQDTLPTMPRYDRYEKLRREIAGSVKGGALSVVWADDSKSFTYSKEAKTYRFDIAAGKESEITGDVPVSPPPVKRGRAGGPERGRQFDTAISPDGKLKAVSRDRNVFISEVGGRNEVAVTTEGSASNRIKFGIASWVYGEELGVNEAMWWSPDAKKLAFYKFDEALVKDYYLQYNQSKIQDTLDVEAYPKAGAPNPIVTLCVYDLENKTTTTVETRFGDAARGEYVYDVRWSSDGKSLYFNRTDRKQKTMEFCAADPSTGASRTVISELQPQSWAENHPLVQFLKDGKRFIWSSERNGFRNLYLYDLNGTLVHSITDHLFDTGEIVRLSDDEKTLWYMARSGSNPYRVQLHRVQMDGRKDIRLTDPDLSHTVSLSPDARSFVDVQQAVDVPPTTVLRTADGRVVAALASADMSKFESLHLHKTEKFTFLAADRSTTCYGSLSIPSDFDPNSKYPLIVSVYGGPESSGGGESFQPPNPITELGFVHATFDGRGTKSRGKAFRDAVYGKLGVVEIDDQAAGVSELTKRPFIDAKRVGIYGTSYGGYASTMALLRHPKVFQVACASSPVTDWLNYDSIYTERYMGLPDKAENAAGYDAGAAKTYAKDLVGKLMLYYGSADNNVHPSNTLQLIKELEAAGKRYDLQVGPDRGHTSMPATRMWEYFVTHLILNSPKQDSLAMVYRARRK